MDCSLPSSSVHGIFQARVLEWGAIAFSERQELESSKVSKSPLKTITSQVASQVAQWVKNPPAMQEMQADTGSIPRSVRSPGEGHSNPLQYCCLENPMDRGDWQATVHKVIEADTAEVTEHTTQRALQKNQSEPAIHQNSGRRRAKYY